MKIYKTLISMYCFFLFFSCDSEKNGLTNQETSSKSYSLFTYYDNNKIKEEIRFIDKNPTMKIGYDSVGNVDNIRLFNKKRLANEILFFEDGKLKVKTSLKDSTLIKDGDMYHFFSTGRLKSDWTWENSILKGEARKYHESNGRLKQYMIYSTKGNLMYRKTFNDKGELISVEGEKP